MPDINDLGLLKDLPPDGSGWVDPMALGILDAELWLDGEARAYLAQDGPAKLRVEKRAGHFDITKWHCPDCEPTAIQDTADRIQAFDITPEEAP